SRLVPLTYGSRILASCCGATTRSSGGLSSDPDGTGSLSRFYQRKRVCHSCCHHAHCPTRCDFKGRPHTWHFSLPVDLSRPVLGRRCVGQSPVSLGLARQGRPSRVLAEHFMGSPPDGDGAVRPTRQVGQPGECGGDTVHPSVCSEGWAGINFRLTEEGTPVNTTPLEPFTPTTPSPTRPKAGPRPPERPGER